MLDLLRVITILKAKVKNAGGQKAWAREHGISTGYLCDALHGRREPGDKILVALDLRKVVRYAKKRN